MTTERLGRRWSCPCGTKFYDLHKADALCPRCGVRAGAAPAPKTARCGGVINLTTPPPRCPCGVGGNAVCMHCQRPLCPEHRVGGIRDNGRADGWACFPRCKDAYWRQFAAGLVQTPAPEALQ